jgi:hypothetical protein
MAVERQGRADGRGAQLDRSSSQTPRDIQQRLEAGEKLLWTGRPRRGLMLRAADFILIPFSLVWCGIIISQQLTAFRRAEPIILDLPSIPFVLIGLYLLFGRFIIDAMIRARTVYAITDRRVVIVTGLFGRNVRSIYLRGLTEIEITEGRRGRGTITFGPSSVQATMMRGWPGAGKSLPPAFEAIEGAQQVLEIIRKAQEPL